MNSVVRSTKKFTMAAIVLVMLALCFAAASMAHAQTPTVLYNFQNLTTDVCNISGTVAQGRDGNLYGASASCGANGFGGVYKITPAGIESLVASFPNGWSGCRTGLTLGADGNFYGSCVYGPFASGNIYKVTPAGIVTDLFDFTGASGALYPIFSPIQGSDGNFYGTTGFPGAACGNVYKLTPAGVETSLHTFSGDCTPTSGLTQASDGNFYGTLNNCSLTGNRGCIYKITPAGVYTVIYGFTDATGAFPTSGVIQGKDGKLYGVNSYGGAIGPNGVIYKVTTAGGGYTALHNINASTDGALDSILQATDGSFYGVGETGGSSNQGSLYKLTSANVFSPFLLDGTTTGADPRGPLTQHTNGLIYGTAFTGGSHSLGTFFKVSSSSTPFVSLVTVTAKEAAKIGILGQGFTAASVVKFGGVTATTVTRTGTTFLLATVPAGALTGSVTVTTGTTTLTSAQTFKVKPAITSFAPPSGPVGTSVTITGTGLVQATKVTFNGTVATFTVDSDTQITATVPAGATTGKIAVTTKGGSVSSLTSFTVN